MASENVVAAVRLLLLSSLLLLLLPLSARAHSARPAADMPTRGVAAAPGPGPASAGARSLSRAAVPSAEGSRFRAFHLELPPLEHGAFRPVRGAPGSLPVLRIQLEGAHSEPLLSTAFEPVRPARIEDLLEGELIDLRLTGY